MLPNLYQKAWSELKEMMPKFDVPHQEFLVKWGDKLATKGVIEHHTMLG
jgi:hypothetical protein